MQGDNFFDDFRRLKNQFKKMIRDFNEFEHFESEFENNNLKQYRRANSHFNETEKEYIIEIEIPGIEKKDIKLEVTSKGIIIKAQKGNEKKEQQGNSYNYESSSMKFYKAFTLPEDSDTKNLEASYKDGLLKIIIPKSLESQKKKFIQIK